MTAEYESTVELRPLDVFSANGKLKGTIAAYAIDDDRILCEVFSPNWSLVTERDKAAAEYEKWTQVPSDRMLAAIQVALALARTAESDQRAAEAAEAAAPAAIRPAAIPPGAPHTDGRPRVKTTNRELQDLAADGWEVIAEINRTSLSYFNLAAQLVDLQVSTRGVPQPRVLSAAALKGVLVRGAYWFKPGTDGTDQLSRPPKDMLDDMLEYGAPPVPIIAGVVTSPYCKTDGGIVTESGYSDDTLLYLHLGDLKPRPVPDKPTSQDLDAAHTLVVDELLGDFPFVTDTDRAHAVGAMILPMVRPMVHGPTPLHMIEAPVEGSGKGLLAQAIVLPATGAMPTVIGAPTRDEDWQKVLTSVLMTAPDVILIDNVEHKLHSGAFATMLTTTEWTDRAMGTHRQITLRNRALWLATANNPDMSREIARRTLRIRIDPKVERPWARAGSHFRHADLLGWARQHRADLLWACMVMIRWWVTEGRPLFSGTPRGSFESYSHTLGGILEVNGIYGFMAESEELHSSASTDIGGWADLVEAWYRVYQDQPVSASKLVKLTYDNDIMIDLRSGRSESSANSAMGRAVSKMKDRVINGFVIELAGYSNSRKRNEYQVRRVRSDE